MAEEKFDRKKVQKRLEKHMSPEEARAVVDSLYSQWGKIGPKEIKKAIKEYKARESRVGPLQQRKKTKVVKHRRRG